MKRAPLLLPLCLAAFLLTSCGETFVEVSTRNRAELDTLRADLKNLGELVAANPPAKGLAAPLDPAPNFKEDDMAASNAVVLAWERLADPTKEFKGDELLNLYFSNGLENLFVWSSGEEKAFKTFEIDLKEAFALRYLVAYKKIELKEPQVDASLNYTIGGAVLGVHLFDRKKREIVCSFPVTAQSAAEVNYTYREGEDQVSAAQSWAHSSLWENLRDNLLKTLAEKTGGSFVE